MRTDCTPKLPETDEEGEADESWGGDSRCVMVIVLGERTPKGVGCGARSGERGDGRARDSVARVTSMVRTVFPGDGDGRLEVTRHLYKSLHLTQ